MKILHKIIGILIISLFFICGAILLQNIIYPINYSKFIIDFATIFFVMSSINLFVVWRLWIRRANELENRKEYAYKLLDQMFEENAKCKNLIEILLKENKGLNYNLTIPSGKNLN